MMRRASSSLLLISLVLLIIGSIHVDARGLTSSARVRPIRKPDRRPSFSSSPLWKSSLGKAFSRIWSKALRQSFFEQEVEDINSCHKIDDHLVRRLIVMPLTDRFEPNPASPMHGKIQFGDKCSLPASVGRYLFDKRLEVPWLFELTPVRGVDSSFAPKRIQKQTFLLPNTSNVNATSSNEQSSLLTRAYISPLDFRAPENYIFLPQWLMKDLGLRANDVVDVSFVRIKLASLVVLQPLTLVWDEVVQQHGDAKTLLERELNKYSSLTAGSTISIKIDGYECSFFVKETQAEGGVSVHGVRVQDADIRTDIDRSLLEKLKK